MRHLLDQSNSQTARPLLSPKLKELQREVGLVRASRSLRLINITNDACRGPERRNDDAETKGAQIATHPFWPVGAEVVAPVHYPGHGYSDIPDGPYDADFFVKYVNGFLEELDLVGVTVAGVSIGASISLILAARHNPRIIRVIPINPYDYHQGKGMARASLLGRLVVGLAIVPVVGDTVMRLRNYFIMKNILAGGVSDPESISPALMKEMYQVGNRRGHYRAFMNLLRHSSSWELARSEYKNINVPTFMIWGAE